MLTARSVKHLTRLFSFVRLLGREVEVESGLKPVKLELTWREEVSWRWSGLKRESLLGWLSWLLEARLLNLLSSLSLLEARLLNWSLTSRSWSNETLLMRSIKGIDEWVNSSTVSTGRNIVDKVSSMGIVVVVVLGGKVGSVSVEVEVTVSRVMGVDEWVEVRINWCINIVIVGLCNRSCLTNRCSNLDRSSTDGSNRGRGKTSSSGGNMSSFQDSESILASSVSDGDSLAIIINITVLANPFTVSSGFLPEHGSILLCKSRSMSAISGIESLLFQNLSILRLNKLTASGSNET